MKKILVYGDSNVWGDNFITGRRIPDEKQWVNILEKELPNYQFYQEGLPGRVAGALEDSKKYKNGKDTFLATYKTCAPVDIVIIALGTNDLQEKYARTGKNILNDLMWYKNCINELFSEDEDKIKYFINESLPKIIYISPVVFDIRKASDIFNEKSNREREKLNELAKKDLDNWIDIGKLPLFDDGIHLNFEGHAQIAKIIKEAI